MNIQLIKGHFKASEGIELITQMIHVKIKFLEGKIAGDSSEEDIKMREKRIKQLQKDLFEARKHLEQASGLVDIHAEIEI